MRRATAVLIAVLAACSTAGVAHALTASSGGTPTGTVVLIGDSNDVYGATALDHQLLQRDNGWLVVNAARPGATVRFGDCPQGTSIPTNRCATYDYWQHRLDTIKATVDASVYVVDLGLNDTINPGTAAGPGYRAYSSKIDWLLAQLDAPVVWSNLPCKIEPAAYRKGCAAVNGALAAATARHPNLTVADWGSAANAHPGYLGAPGGVHLTVAGATVYAALIAKALR